MSDTNELRAVKLTNPEMDALVECGSWKNGMHPGWKQKTMPKLAAKGLAFQAPGRSASGSGSNWWHLTPAGRALLAKENDHA